MKVTDGPKLQRIADAYAAEGWEPTVRDGTLYAEFSAPAAGPPPWDVYEVTPKTVFALGTASPTAPPDSASERGGSAPGQIEHVFDTVGGPGRQRSGSE